MKFSLILLLIAVTSCQSETDKTTIADQKKTIDSLEIELNDYKLLHSVAKEIIEKDTTYTN
jgi:ABC-type proline/glycine betaine transport system substrate-binding protein